MKAQVRTFINAVERKWKAVFCIQLLLQVGLMLFMLISKGVLIAGDTPTYVEPAISFLTTGRMIDEGSPMLIRTPGYPLLLALLYKFFGVDNSAVVIVQVAMSIGISVMIFSTVFALTSSHALACSAVCFYILDWDIYWYAITILSDVPFAFFMVLALLFLSRYIMKRKISNLFFCYASLLFAGTIRGLLYYYLIILAIVLILFSLCKRVKWKISLMYLVMFVIVVGGWIGRNQAVFGEAFYTPLRELNIYTFAKEEYALLNGIEPAEAGRTVFDPKLYQEYPDYDELPMLEKFHASGDIGKQYISRHIPGYFLLNLKGLVTEMIAPNLSQIYALNMEMPVKMVLACFLGGILLISYLIYAVGFLGKIRKQKWIDWVILLTVMYIMASTAAIGYSRFRIAFYPLCLVGAFSCLRHWHKVDTNKAKS